ncbi:MerR family transcriptional regulator, partial [Christensenellaceae bacterium OttesenSCG-928-K19]|nr:MerR family transcriptional regulator [Christensenellaceae bacterium OttesenSCG-928-K19]
MVNSFRTCQWCGGIYTYMGNPLCPKCVKEQEEDFQKVKKYLYENPGAGVEEVVEETEVDIKRVMHFLREGRLEMKNAD